MLLGEAHAGARQSRLIVHSFGPLLMRVGTALLVLVVPGIAPGSSPTAVNTVVAGRRLNACVCV